MLVAYGLFLLTFPGGFEKHFPRLPNSKRHFFGNPVTDPAEKITRPQSGSKFAEPILPRQTFVLQLGSGHNRPNAVASTRDEHYVPF